LKSSKVKPYSSSATSKVDVPSNSSSTAISMLEVVDVSFIGNLGIIAIFYRYINQASLEKSSYLLAE
jgi:hypothetical protein